QRCTAIQQSDLRSICCMLQARRALLQADTSGAIEQTRAALHHAERATNPALVARAHTLLFHALTVAHDPSAVTHRDSAWRVYNRLASELPESYREMFWAHPERLPLLASSRMHPVRTTEAGRTIQRGRLQQFLAVNRRINSTLSIDQVLSAALDA